MASIVPTASERPIRQIRRSDHLFYSGMSLVIAAIVVAGFSRTFYLRAWFDVPAISALRWVHGAVFSGWILLFIAQTMLVASGRVAVHRRLGVLGAVLAAGVLVVGYVLAVTSAREGHSPPGIPPRVFLIIPIFDLLVFAPLVAAGVYYRRRPETHKRLMLLATVSILAAAVARLPVALATAGPPFYFGVVDLLILMGVAYDVITRRRVHPVYIWGGLFVVASQVLRLMLSGTGAWLSVADRLVGP
jgi:hypothetical protein